MSSGRRRMWNTPRSLDDDRPSALDWCTSASAINNYEVRMGAAYQSVLVMSYGIRAITVQIVTRQAIIIIVDIGAYWPTNADELLIVREMRANRCGAMADLCGCATITFKNVRVWFRFLLRMIEICYISTSGAHLDIIFEFALMNFLTIREIKATRAQIVELYFYFRFAWGYYFRVRRRRFAHCMRNLSVSSRTGRF
jgi:hypothetical protein